MLPYWWLHVPQDLYVREQLVQEEHEPAQSGLGQDGQPVALEDA